MIIAVDGPAGSGKSSVCASVSEKLGWVYINTGFLYRALGVVARQRGTDIRDSGGLQLIIDEFNEALVWDAEGGNLLFGDRNLTPYLHTEQAGADASYVAKDAGVRERLLPLQRKLPLQSPTGAIVDGRDIGTVVFPDADLKIFMTASLEERARRRVRQLNELAGDESAADFETVKNDIAARDEQDAGRAAAPLKQADDAVVFDTSALPFDQAVESLIRLIKDKV